jgi:hypothetical protein
MKGHTCEDSHGRTATKGNLCWDNHDRTVTTGLHDKTDGTRPSKILKLCKIIKFVTIFTAFPTLPDSQACPEASDVFQSQPNCKTLLKALNINVLFEV